MTLSLARRFAIGFSWNYAGQITGMAVGMVSSTVIARGLGPSQYGEYAVILGLIGLVSLFTSFGLGEAVMTYLPRLLVEAGQSGKVAFFLRWFLLTRVFIGVAGAALAYVLAGPISAQLGRPELAPYLQLYSPTVLLLAINGLLQPIFPGALRIAGMTLVNIAAQLLNLGLTYLLLQQGHGIFGVILATLVSTFFTLLCYLYLARVYLSPRPVSIALRRMYQFGFTIWIGSLIGFGLGRDVDIVLLSRFGVPVADIGFYRLSVSLSVLLAVLTSGLGPVALAAFSEAHARGGKQHLGTAWSTVLKMLGFLVLPPFFFFIFQIGDFVELLYAAEYATIVNYFRVFAVLSIIATLIGTSYSSAAFYALNLERLDVVLQSGGGFLNIVLDVLLIPILGVYGVILGTGVANVIVSVVKAWFVVNRTQAKVPIFFHLRLSLLLLLAGACTLVPIQFLPVILRLAINGVIYVGVAAGLAYFFKPLDQQTSDLVRRVDKRLANVIDLFGQTPKMTRLETPLN